MPTYQLIGPPLLSSRVRPFILRGGGPIASVTGYGGPYDDDYPQFASEIVSGQPPPPSRRLGGIQIRKGQANNSIGMALAGLMSGCHSSRGVSRCRGGWSSFWPLIAAMAGAVIVSAVLDSGRHEGMPDTSGAAVLAGICTEWDAA
jgi:hypothetical protein